MMNKTLELFKKYGLVEADEMDATDMAEQPPIQDPAEMTPEGEKYLVGLLLKAFLHVPDDSEGRVLLKSFKGRLKLWMLRTLLVKLKTSLSLVLIQLKLHLMIFRYKEL